MDGGPSGNDRLAAAARPAPANRTGSPPVGDEVADRKRLELRQQPVGASGEGVLSWNSDGSRIRSHLSGVYQPACL